LGHDQLNILVLKTRSINLLSIIFVLILLVITGINSLALSVSVVVIVIMARVIVSGVVVSLSSSELLGSRSLSLGVKVLNLGLTEDARCLVRIACRYWA
jgi:hypothetical protein